MAKDERFMERAFLIAAGAALTIVIGVGAPTVGAATARADARDSVPEARASKTVGTVPRQVTSHAVGVRRHHDANAVLALNVGLAVHHSAELDEVIRAASTPGDPAYGHYLTQTQYKARYAPTDAEVAAVRSWLTGSGLRVTGVSVDNLIVSAEAKTSVAERAFAVTINDYRGPHSFYANDVAPSVPATSPVQSVTGLDNSLVVKTFVEPAYRSGGYFPSDFQTGYNTGGATTTQTIGFTLWGAPLEQSDLHAFATHTVSPEVDIDGVGPDGITFIPCSTLSCNPSGTQSTDTGVWVETALDVESAHGVAPGSRMKYWLGSTDGSGHASVAALEQALDAAANDSVKVVSNSWGFDADVHLANMDASLQHAAAVGKTFFFSSGDSATVSYPATSPYVVSVGGTNLNLSGSFGYVSERAWSGSGTGCSEVFGRPSWQVGVGTFATCDGRAEPDVAADADPATGAYVEVGGLHGSVGGTSLAAPLWAGMTAVWNQANITAGKPEVGFAAPLLYSLGNNKIVYHDTFHDVTTGSAGGNPAGAGWDQVTGWGSPNLANLIAASQGLAPTSTTLAASKNPGTAGGTVVYTATVSPVPNGGTVTFRQDSDSISGCSAKALTAGGHATCSAKYLHPATFKIQAGYSGNAGYSGGSSKIITEKIVAAPSTAGYWMAGRTGAVYGFGSSAWLGSANTQNVSHFEPTPSRHG
ncbi:MAG: hypothetical protein QOF28_1953, partial [Actinomycetota bacterium]|nr:hypothetical protein [Actinomycetota bacterium]